jgi:hypothetical protein
LKLLYVMLFGGCAATPRGDTVLSPEYDTKNTDTNTHIAQVPLAGPGQGLRPGGGARTKGGMAYGSTVSVL